jgi:rubrerythrin
MEGILRQWRYARFALPDASSSNIFAAESAARRRAVSAVVRCDAQQKKEALPMDRAGELIVPERRSFLGKTVLSAAAVALLSGRDVLAQGMSGGSADVNILNVALGLEYEGINAYQLGAQSGLLQKPVLDVATRFQTDHKEHRDALIATIRRLGGKPVEEKPIGEYAKALKADTLKSQADVLELAARLELGATNAYLGVIPSFKDPQLAKVAGRLAADEVMHWTILNNALGKPLPAGGMPFGA